jgi:hypothetical protein
MRVSKQRLTLIFGIAIGLATGYLLFKVAPAELLETHSKRSSIEFWGDHYITDNTRFYFPYNYIPGGLVLRERIRVDRRGGVEGADGTVTLDAFDWHMKPLWSFHEPGEKGTMYGLSDRLYKVTKTGCCDAPGKYTYFSLVNGKKLYWSNHDESLIEVELPVPRYHSTGNFYYGSLTRYVLVATSIGLNGNTVVIQYGSDKELIRTANIETYRDNFVPDDGVTIIYNGKQLSNTPGRAIETSRAEGIDKNSKSTSDFVISLRFKDGTELKIPVENDDINAKGVKVPSKFKVAIN